MNTPFDTAFNYLIGDEGSKYTNNPKDSGGPTKWGITKKTYSAFFGYDASDEDIQTMSAMTAKRIYFSEYWKHLRGDEIQSLVLAISFLDSAVLYGVGTIALLIQRSLNLCGATLKLDGVIGDKTLESINSIGGGDQGTRFLTNTFCGLLLEHIDAVIVANPKDEEFRRGWTLRADRLLRLLNDQYLNHFQTMENI